MEQINIISDAIAELLYLRERLYLPNIGTLYLSDSTPSVVVYLDDDSGVSIIDSLISKHGIEQAHELYEQWFAQNMSQHDSYALCRVEGLGIIEFRTGCTQFIAEQRESDIALNEEAQLAIEEALVAADRAPEEEYLLESLTELETTIREQEELEDREEQNSQETETEPDTELETELEEVVEELEESRSQAMNWRAIAIVLAILLIIVSTISSYYFGTRNRSQDSIVEVVRDTIIIDRSLEQQSEPHRESYGKYHIIAGAFEFKKNAQKLTEIAIMDGYNAVAFYSPQKRLYMVSIINGDDKAKLHKMLPKLKSYDDEDPLWVYEYDITETL